MGKHSYERHFKRMYWWQRKRHIEAQVRSWILDFKEFKADFFDTIEDIKKEKNARKNDERNT
jgi:hypothetical protein